MTNLKKLKLSVLKAKKYAPVLLLFFAGCFISWLAADLNHQEEIHHETQEIDNQAARHVSALRLGLEEELNTLQGMTAFFHASEFVSEEEYRTFLDDIYLNKTAFKSLAWVPRVPKERRQAFEQEVRRTSQKDFLIYELDENGQKIASPEKEVYYPVLYAFRQEGPSPVKGFDFSSQPNRLKLIERAIRSKSVAASGALDLITEDTKGRKAFILGHAFFREGELQGINLGVTLFSDFVETSLNRFFLNPSFKFHTRIIDLENPIEDAILYSSLPSSPESATYQYKEELQVADRTWEVQNFIFYPVFGSVWDTSGILFILCMVINFGFCLIIFLEMKKSALIYRKVKEQTRTVRVWGAQLEEAKKELAASQEDLKLALGIGKIGVWRWHCKDDILVWDDGMMDVFQRNRKDFKGNYAFFDQCLHPEDRERVAKEVQAALDEKRIFENEFRALGKDGEIIHIYARGRGIYDDHGDLISMSGINMDITEKKNSEEKLRQEEQRFRMMLEQVPAIVWSVDENFTITSSMGSGLEALGLKNNQLEGTSLLDYIQSNNIKDPTLKAIHDALAGKSVTQETTFKDIVFQTRFQPFRDQEGKIKGVSVLSLNVTDVKKLQDQLRQSQKMESVGQLAGGIAHDFNNILNVIIGYAQCVWSETADEDPKKEDLSEILAAANRAADLTSRLLAYSRRQTLQPQVINLNQEIKNMNRMLSPLIGENIQWETKLDETIPDIFADPGPIHQVIINLVVNARDAMPEGGKLTLKTSREELTAETKFKEVPPGEYVTLQVSDTGEGIKEDLKNQIFEPFFTTKEVGKGSGLGLSMVYGVMKQSGGFVYVDSQEGKGSTFTLYFPKTKETHKNSSKNHHSSREEIKGTESILVIEDEKPVRRLVTRVLEKQGFKVREAANGKEAIHVLEDMKGEAALILSDMVLPDARGDELSEKIKKSFPEIKFIFMSGYTDKDFGHFNLNEEIPFIQKPFTPDALLKKIRGALDKAA